MKNKIDFYKVSHKRKRGRPRKVALEKTEYAMQVSQLQNTRLKGDSLYNSLGADPDNPSALDLIMRELAKEAVILDVDRSRALSKEEDTSAITAKRVHTLKATGDFWLKKHAILHTDQLDLKSKSISKLYEFFLEKVAESAEASGMSAEAQGIFFQTLAVTLEDWQKEADAYINSVSTSKKTSTKDADEDDDF